MVELDETVTHVYSMFKYQKRMWCFRGQVFLLFWGGISVHLFLNADIRTVGNFVSFCVSVVSDRRKQDNVSPKDEE